MSITKSCVQAFRRSGVQERGRGRAARGRSPGTTWVLGPGPGGVQAFRTTWSGAPRARARPLPVPNARTPDRVPAQRVEPARSARRSLPISRRRCSIGADPSARLRTVLQTQRWLLPFLHRQRLPVGSKISAASIKEPHPPGDRPRAARPRPAHLHRRHRKSSLLRLPLPGSLHPPPTSIRPAKRAAGR